jgi:DNA-binding response OmpR family regulator
MLDAETPTMVDAATDATTTERQRILVAEDDDAMRELIVETLTAAGYEVRAVADGAELLVELARRDRFHYRTVDLVLADLRMPHCSGIEVFDAMAGARVRPKFAVLTAFPDESSIASAEALGAVVIAKPVTMARLVAIVAELLRERRVG